MGCSKAISFLMNTNKRIKVKVMRSCTIKEEEDIQRG
jgi:hypothetical protein